MRRIALLAISAVALTASFHRPARAESFSSAVVDAPASGDLVAEFRGEPSCSKSPVLCCSDAPLVALEMDRHRELDELSVRALEVDVSSLAVRSDHRIDRARPSRDAHRSRNLRAQRPSWATTKGLLPRVQTFRRMEPHEDLAQLVPNGRRHLERGSPLPGRTICTV